MNAPTGGDIDRSARIPPPFPVVVNTRVLLNPLTGVQRYVQEILSRLPGSFVPVRPPFRMTSALNQAWEQVALPRRVGRRLLWSPANTGPLSVENQVLTLHDVAPLDHPEWYRPAFARYAGWLLPRLARRVRHIITVSEFTRTRIRELTGVPGERVTVIPVGTNAAFAPPPSGEIREAAARHGLTPDQYVLYVGSIEPRKNLVRLLEAWESCRRRLPAGLVLAIAGDRANPRAFRAVPLALTDPSIRWLGRVEDRLLPGLMAGARFFAYVSLYEGFGAPPLEAMTVGAPVLTSSAASLPEVVGEAALSVDPLDVSAIAAGIERLAGDDELRRSLRERGLARAAGFSYDATAAATWSVLDACR